MGVGTIGPAQLLTTVSPRRVKEELASLRSPQAKAASNTPGPAREADVTVSVSAAVGAGKPKGSPPGGGPAGGGPAAE